MNPLWILAAGMAVVVGGVLWGRLHAFLALILGALVVALLTPEESLRQYVAGEVAAGQMSQAAGEALLGQTVGDRVAVAFGNTCTQIAILIAMAAVIGKCLLDSGAADRIVRSALRLLGEARAPLAFLFSGFTLGIPVFFDTVFYLMIPLGKAMWMRTQRNYLFYVLTITAGATMAHSLVPPTPGPLLVADILRVNIGNMIVAGLVVGICTILYGYFHAALVNRLASVPVRESAELSLADLQRAADRDERQLPPLWLSLLPVVLPVVLISGYAIAKPYLPAAVDQPAAWQVTAGAVIRTLGNKNIALVLAAGLALFTLAWQRKTSRRELAAAVQNALAGGGVIILITAGGGAFGGMLRQTGIGYWLQQQQMAPTSIAAVLLLAFGLTTLVRTAQGSATVAMITAVGIIAPLIDGESLGCDPVYVALAIGCGSKPISWMNDSGFWVIAKMSGMTETETLSYVTPMTAMMGLVGLLVTLAGAIWWPYPFGAG